MLLLRRALDDPHLVQSFSGVRTRFGDGPDIEPEKQALSTAYGYFYGRSMEGSRHPVILARDPRPTGRAVTQALVRGLLSAGITEIVDLGIITTPLAQSAVRSFNAAGGIIVTASHNPLCDNGWKFLTPMAGRRASAAPEGALLAAQDMESIIQCVAHTASEGDPVMEDALAAVSPRDSFSALLRSGSRRAHNTAAGAYISTIANDWRLDVDDVRGRHLGPIVLDSNGGSASGLNSGVLEELGVRVYEMNGELSRPAHPIDTDSINPETGEHVLLRVARAVEDCEALFGIAFDYDADRGNLVLPGQGSECVVAPQSVSALNVALSLARWKANGRDGIHTRVVASDSTSRRVEEIASAFGASVAWVETGEVNVVTRMRELAIAGYEVPVGVEGANGGTVFAGSTCRDGLLTALSCALAEAGEPALPILSAALRIDLTVGSAGLQRILAALPDWHTESCKMQVNPAPHNEVKSMLEGRFECDIWPGISHRYRSYRFANFEGTRETAERSGDHTGGWRVELERPGASPFLFARGSRTEAGVWRLIADSPDAEEARYLLQTAVDAMKGVAADFGPDRVCGGSKTGCV